jgi:hypothetical protein
METSTINSILSSDNIPWGAAILTAILFIFFLKSKITLLEKHKIKIIILLVSAFIFFVVLAIALPYVPRPAIPK